MDEIEALRSQYPGETTEQLLARALQEIANMRTKPDQPATQPTPQLTASPPEALPRHDRKAAILPKPPVFEGERDEYVN
jgi:hypothetical protein